MIEVTLKNEKTKGLLMVRINKINEQKDQWRHRSIYSLGVYLVRGRKQAELIYAIRNEDICYSTRIVIRRGNKSEFGCLVPF